MKSIVLATNNPGKVAEFKIFFEANDIQIIPQSDFSVPSINETGLTFVENAILKARNCCNYMNMHAIGDDSGLEVDALKGQPGIYSARYAGEDATQEKHILKLLNDLDGVPEEERSARFQCVLVYLRYAEDPVPIIAQGTWEGVILTEPRGQQGFGYDPVFYASSEKCTAAQLTPERKNQLSHRAQAMRELMNKLKTNI